MTMTSTAPTRRLDVLHPVVAATFGAAVFAVAMIAGSVFDLNSDSADAPSTTAGDIAGYVGLVLVAAAIATWLGVRARAGTPRRLAVTALGLGLASAATFVGFWSGWPQIFGAVAIALSFEYRRRVGSLSAPALIGLILGLLSFAASAFVCVIG